MLRAIEYGRFSSNNQREESIDAQFRAIREYSQRNNIVIVGTYKDEAVSGKSDDRDEFQQMISDILSKRIDVDFVLVHKFNRFARNKFDSAIYKKRLKEKNVKVISVSQNIDDTPEGAMMESFLEAMDEYYSANLALEVRKGLRENALKGKRNGGIAPLGFSVNEQGFFIINEQSEIVKRIFTEYAQGVPTSQICEKLNREGLRNQKGKTFKIRTISDILKNEKYIGNYSYTINKTEVIRHDGILPAIIDSDLWDKVQARINQPIKRKYRSETKNIYHLTGKGFCAHCGNGISGGGSKYYPNGKVIRYYRCVGKYSHKNGCKATNVNKMWLEEAVCNVVIESTMDEAYMRKLSLMAYEEIIDVKKNPASTIDRFNKELSSIIEKQRKLTGLYLEGDIDKNVLDIEIKKMKQRKHEIEREVDKRKAVSNSNDLTAEFIYEFLKAYIEEVKISTADNLDEFKRAIIGTFVEKVIISVDSITVNIKVDFSTFNFNDFGSDKRQSAGAIRYLSPLFFCNDFPRPKQYSKTSYHTT